MPLISRFKGTEVKPDIARHGGNFLGSARPLSAGVLTIRDRRVAQLDRRVGGLNGMGGAG